MVGILDHMIANTGSAGVCTINLDPLRFIIKQRSVKTAQYCFWGLGNFVLKSLPFWLDLVKLGRDMRETSPDGVVI